MNLTDTEQSYSEDFQYIYLLPQNMYKKMVLH